MRATLRAAVTAALLLLPRPALAQRDLHWDALNVDAHLDADGSLQIVETQSMVFTGDWNGGERTFNIRPRQGLAFDGMSRWTGATWQAMTEDADLDDVDDYAFTDRRTLRWRSRRSSDPPFDRTPIRYVLRYRLSGILQADGAQYRLDHDFAFPDRAGSIDVVEVRLTLDPAWQPAAALPPLYSGQRLAPGRSFVVTVPLRFAGSGPAPDLAWSRPLSIRIALLMLLGATVLASGLLLAHERRAGRFAPVDVKIVDRAWLDRHLLKYPAELVSAAWDDSIGRPEVVTLLARLASEGKLTSTSDEKTGEMTLRLAVAKTKFRGYERTLIDKLFFGQRTTTTTAAVAAHYKSRGFDPVSVIRKELEASLRSTFPFADAARHYRRELMAVYITGVVLLAGAWLFNGLPGLAVLLILLGAAVLTGLAVIPGMSFRKRMEWGWPQALLCLLPALAVAAGVAVFLWFFAGTGDIELAILAIAAIVVLAFGVLVTALYALRSRQAAEGIAFRKVLAAARLFFIAQLRTPQPALRDEWYPWLLAFELERQMTDWSVARAASGAGSDTFPRSSDSGATFTSSSAASSPSSWSGFGGGQSGGAGASASWAAAVGGFAASVAAPSASGSSGGSDSGGSSGSSGGGSSGGGGGGGW